MQQDREFRELSRALQTFKRRGEARYPAKLRARIRAWVIARRERGDWWTEIGEALGISTQTLVRWAEASSSAAPEMKAVDVIDAPPIGTVTLVAPTGLRIEGVSIEAAIALLRGIA
jgi:hypothetical protein